MPTSTSFATYFNCRDCGVDVMSGWPHLCLAKICSGCGREYLQALPRFEGGKRLCPLCDRRAAA